MKKTPKLLVAALLAASSCAPQSDEDFCAVAYGDIVSFIVQGYQCHWDGFGSGEMKLSDVYRYESERCGSCRKDINGDGVPELLLGDGFPDGSYLLYDIFTFDKKTNSPVHLLRGGERDRFTIKRDGTIVEAGSSGAADSFTKYYRIKNAVLADVTASAKGTAGAAEDLMAIDIDPFIRYVAPTAFVALEGGNVLGQLTRTLDEGYEIEAQDTVILPKEGIMIELWSAWDGKGIVCLKKPGTEPVYATPRKTAAEGDKTDADTAKIIGTASYEEGYCPDCYPCLGYTRGWFKIDFGGKAGYIREDAAVWDFADRN